MLIKNSRHSLTFKTYPLCFSLRTGKQHNNSPWKQPCTLLLPGFAWLIIMFSAITSAASSAAVSSWNSHIHFLF